MNCSTYNSKNLPMKTHPYNVVWHSPSPDASGSMPLGNGENTINLWVEPSGDLRMYLARSDCWGEFGQLYKLGRIRVRLHTAEGEALLSGPGFRWELKLEQGAIQIETERGKVRVWIDAHHPLLQIHAEGEHIRASLELDLWRNEKRELTDTGERHSLHTGAPYPVYHEADQIPDLEGHQIGWYHVNQSSTWEQNLRTQGLEALLETERDPLLHRCFGGIAFGEGLKKVSSRKLESGTAAPSFAASVILDCDQVEAAADWIQQLQERIPQMPSAKDTEAWQAHQGWWQDFWAQSYIEADGVEAARKISQGYSLQRFMNACAGRGEFPIKFNGSLFTVDWNYDGTPYMGSERFDADYRRWGPGYWHQNTRLPYWSMLSAGDFESMRPYFEMYRRALPLATERVRKFCGHAGAMFTETMYFWGSYLEHNYGWGEGGGEPQREAGLAGHLPHNGYIRRHNSSGLEVVYHALLFHRYTEEESFLQETLFPLAEAVLDYYDLQFPRKEGKLHLSPAQVIEQWWEADNPMPELAGLRACLDALLALPELPEGRRHSWTRFRSEVPELPTYELEGETRFAPAERWEGPAKNMENPELYAIFPYHHCHIDSDDVEIGITSFRKRAYTHDQGWAQDGMQAALLGLEADARVSVTSRLSTPSAYARFPAFWGPSFDWLPDQDQGGSASHALQLMLMQVQGDQLRLLPAWPDHWPVRFRLAGPYRTWIRCEKEAGEAPRWEIEGDAADRIRVIL